jgi:hypothetical protein
VQCRVLYLTRETETSSDWFNKKNYCWCQYFSSL